MCNYFVKSPEFPQREKYDNNRKGGYLRFDDDNNMSYRYILSITYTEMGQLSTYPICCNENKK